MAPVAPGPYRHPVYAHSWWMMLFAGVLFIIGAFAASGDALGDITFYTWFSAAFAAWALSSVVP